MDITRKSLDFDYLITLLEEVCDYSNEIVKILDEFVLDKYIIKGTEEAILKCISAVGELLTTSFDRVGN